MSVKFNSSGGGSVTLDAPSTASNLTVTLPSASGTLVSTGSPFSGGTANGVVYLNGSSVPTTGSALTFNGSDLLVGNGTNGQLNFNGSSYGQITTQTLLYIDGSDQVFRSSAGAERMRLNSTGLGIGTNSPSVKLDVLGQIRNGSGADASPYTQARITVYSDASNWGYIGYGQDALMRVVHSNTSSAYPLLFGMTSAINNTGTFTETMRLKADGGVVLKGGNTGATGTGITFPATQSASSDANTLDDYEEGTWTPVIVGSASQPTVTYGNQRGRYTKIGRVVSVTGQINTSSLSGGSGDFNISGLPFINAFPTWSASTISYAGTGGSSAPTLCMIDSNNTSFGFWNGTSRLVLGSYSSIDWYFSAVYITT